MAEREVTPIAGCCIDIDGVPWHEAQSCWQARSRAGLARAVPGARDQHVER